MEAFRGRTGINRRMGADSDAYIENQESGLVDYADDVSFVGNLDVLDETKDEIEYEITDIVVQIPTVDEDYIAHYVQGILKKRCGCTLSFTIIQSWGVCFNCVRVAKGQSENCFKKHDKTI